MPDTTASPAAISGGNPYDISQPQPVTQPFGMFGGSSDPNATGALGQSNGFWNGLTNFGANMITASNARTSFGTLANPGFLGAFGAGLAATEAQGRTAASNYADIQGKNAQTLGQQLKNRLDMMQFPTEQARQNYLQQYWQQLNGGQSPTAAATTTPSDTSKQPTVGGPFVAKNLPAWVTPDEDAVVRTVWGESRGESPQGQQAVASVIANRAAQSGTSRSDVVYAPGQFEPWNDPRTRPALEKLDPNSPEYQKIFTNIRPVLAGTGQDVTNGSTFFYSPTAQAALGRDTPSWAVNQQPEVTIGRHQFYKLPFGTTVAGGQQPPAPAPATSQPAQGPQASAQPAPQVAPPVAAPPTGSPAATAGMPQQNAIAARLAAGDNPALAAPQQQAAAQPQAQSVQQTPFKPYQLAGAMQPPPPSSITGSSPNVERVGDYGGPGIQRPAPQVQAQAQPPTQLAPPRVGPASQPPAPTPAPTNAADTLAAAKQMFQQRDQMNAQAAQLEQQQKAWNNQAEFLKSQGAPMDTQRFPYPSGDPALIRQQAGAYNAKGIELQASVPLAVAKSANENVQSRPDAITRMMNPDGTTTMIRGPHYTEQTLGQDTTIGGTVYPAGTKLGGYTNMPPLGSPEGTQGQFVPSIDQSTGRPLVIGLAPQVQESRNEANKEFTGAGTDTYIAAQNQKALLTQLQDAAQVLHDHGGFVGMGPTSPERIGFLAKINDAIRAVGGTPIEASAVGAWEEMSKATGQLGFETAAKYEGHARTAAQTIINATSINPSAMNSEAGFRRVLAGVQESAQAVTDLHEYEAGIYQRGGDLSTAPVDFFTKNSPRMYGMRAISTMTPYGISDKSETARYLPGTFVKYHGSIFQIPDRPGAPATPDYLKGAPPPQVQSDQSAPVATPAAVPPGSGMGP